MTFKVDYNFQIKNKKILKFSTSEKNIEKEKCVVYSTNKVYV